jgi:succinate dehydrogenase/fumarate reductase flavoprotein subunit
MDCGVISDGDLEYMRLWFKHEGLTSTLNIFEEEQIDLRKNSVEFTTYEILPMGGVYHNERADTSVKGLLYAAGDELVGGGLPGAAVFGWIAGENAALYAKGMEAGPAEKVEAKVEETVRLARNILSQKVCANWKEINIALQQIMQNYARVVRSETLLSAGFDSL